MSCHSTPMRRRGHQRRSIIRQTRFYVRPAQRTAMYFAIGEYQAYVGKRIVAGMQACLHVTGSCESANGGVPTSSSAGITPRPSPHGSNGDYVRFPLSSRVPEHFAGICVTRYTRAPYEVSNLRSWQRQKRSQLVKFWFRSDIGGIKQDIVYFVECMLHS